jgi:hypothetical protein
MRVVYDKNLITTLFLGDLPMEKSDQHDVKPETIRTSYVESIFRNLLVMDGLPDDNFQEVLIESVLTLGMADPGFHILIGEDFERFIQSNKHLAKWGKIEKDYRPYIAREALRRNKQNPYYTDDPEHLEGWNRIPNYSRQKPHQPWQFDHIYRDCQYLAGQVYELTKNYQKQQDKDLFRAKVNSLLAAREAVVGLNANESINDFAEIEISIANIKLSLDAYKLCYMFLNRTIESLHKMSWSYQYSKEAIDDSISFSDQLLESLKDRIKEVERRFMLYIQSGLEQEW